jgi:hypothetical protein
VLPEAVIAHARAVGALSVHLAARVANPCFFWDRAADRSPQRARLGIGLTHQPSFAVPLKVKLLTVFVCIVTVACIPGLLLSIDAFRLALEFRRTVAAQEQGVL